MARNASQPIKATDKSATNLPVGVIPFCPIFQKSKFFLFKITEINFKLFKKYFPIKATYLFFFVNLARTKFFMPNLRSRVTHVASRFELEGISLETKVMFRNERPFF